jgi:hypothetical protein
VRSSVLPALTTKIRQTILHSITHIMAVAADIMDMVKVGECSIGRTLPVRHPRCQVSKNHVFA